MKKRLSVLFSAVLIALLAVQAVFASDPVAFSINGQQVVSSLEEALSKAGETDVISLNGNISLTGAWSGVENFKGIFDGKGYTVSGLMLEKSYGKGLLGFVATNNGTIKNVVFDKAGVNAKGAKNAALIAAVNNGKIEDIVVNDDLSFNAKGAKAAVVASVSNGGSIYNITVNSRLDFTASDAVIMVYEANGTAIAQICFDGSMATLNGFAKKNVITKGFKTVKDCEFGYVIIRDNSESEEFFTPAMHALRDAAVAEMVEMADFKWTPSCDTVYYDWGNVSYDAAYAAGFRGIRYHTSPTKLEYHVGQWYSGIPYNHQTGSYEKTSYFMDENKVLHFEDMPDDFGTRTGKIEDWNGWLGWDSYLGTDCSGSVYQAWSTGSKAYFNSSGSLIPGVGDGVLPVGTYLYEGLKNCSRIILFNDMDTMMESYAKTHKGDGLDYDGHSRLCAESAIVYRDQNGKIDPVKSHLWTHEVGKTIENHLDDHGVMHPATIWRNSKKVTFQTLYGQKTICCTNEEFMTGKQGSMEIRFSKFGMNKGTVSNPAGYPLFDVIAVITDSEGKEVWNHKEFVFGRNENNLRYHRDVRSSYNLGELIPKFVADNVVLNPEETYTYTLTATLRTGVSAQKSCTFKGKDAPLTAPEDVLMNGEYFTWVKSVGSNMGPSYATMNMFFDQDWAAPYVYNEPGHSYKIPYIPRNQLGTGAFVITMKDGRLVNAVRVTKDNYPRAQVFTGLTVTEDGTLMCGAKVYSVEGIKTFDNVGLCKAEPGDTVNLVSNKLVPEIIYVTKHAKETASPALTFKVEGPKFRGVAMPMADSMGISFFKDRVEGWHSFGLAPGLKFKSGEMYEYTVSGNVVTSLRSLDDENGYIPVAGKTKVANLVVNEDGSYTFDIVKSGAVVQTAIHLDKDAVICGKKPTIKDFHDGDTVRFAMLKTKPKEALFLFVDKSTYEPPRDENNGTYYSMIREFNKDPMSETYLDVTLAVDGVWRTFEFTSDASILNPLKKNSSFEFTLVNGKVQEIKQIITAHGFTSITQYFTAHDVVVYSDGTVGFTAQFLPTPDRQSGADFVGLYLPAGVKIVDLEGEVAEVHEGDVIKTGTKNSQKNVALYLQVMECNHDRATTHPKYVDEKPNLVLGNTKADIEDGIYYSKVKVSGSSIKIAANGKWVDVPMDDFYFNIDASGNSNNKIANNYVFRCDVEDGVVLSTKQFASKNGYTAITSLGPSSNEYKISKIIPDVSANGKTYTLLEIATYSNSEPTGAVTRIAIPSTVQMYSEEYGRSIEPYELQIGDVVSAGRVISVNEDGIAPVSVSYDAKTYVEYIVLTTCKF